MAGAKDDAGDGNDGDEVKDSIPYLLRSLPKSEEFTLDPADLVNDDRDTGSNSTRKLAVNLSREIGRSKDETDHRGRWKGSDRQQDQYADTTIPHVDAIVAATLCVGGLIAYFVRNGSGVSSDWILEHVTPHMFAANIPRQVCIVLGRALLWKVWETAHGNLGARNRLEAGTNPVWRANIGVTGIDAELYVFEIMGSGGEDEGGVSGPGAVERGPRTISRGHEVELRFLAPLCAYPWFARIADGPSTCGASLVSDQFVLTAAHCVEDYEATDSTVQIGAFSAPFGGGADDPALNGGQEMESRRIVAQQAWRYCSLYLTYLVLVASL